MLGVLRMAWATISFTRYLGVQGRVRDKPHRQARARAYSNDAAATSGDFLAAAAALAAEAARSAGQSAGWGQASTRTCRRLSHDEAARGAARLDELRGSLAVWMEGPLWQSHGAQAQGAALRTSRLAASKQTTVTGPVHTALAPNDTRH